MCLVIWLETSITYPFPNSIPFSIIFYPLNHHWNSTSSTRLFLTDWGEKWLPFHARWLLILHCQGCPNFSTRSPHSGKLLSLRDCSSLIGIELCFLKILMLEPQYLMDGIWIWGPWKVIKFRWSHKGGALMIRLVSLIRRRDTRELTLPLCQVRTQREVSHLQAKKRCFGRIWPCRLSNLLFPAFRTVSTQFLLLMAPSLRYFVMAPGWLIQLPYLHIPPYARITAKKCSF